VIDGEGNPVRIDKAYSWESPMSSHGLMHMVITNAPTTTLLARHADLFMANMAWNSSMNTRTFSRC